MPHRRGVVNDSGLSNATIRHMQRRSPGSRLTAIHEAGV